MKRPNTFHIELYSIELLKPSTQSLSQPAENRTTPKHLRIGKERNQSCTSIQGHERIPCRCQSAWEFLRNPATCSLGTPEEGRPLEMEMVMGLDAGLESGSESG